MEYNYLINNDDGIVELKSTVPLHRGEQLTINEELFEITQVRHIMNTQHIPEQSINLKDDPKFSTGIIPSKTVHKTEWVEIYISKA